MRNIPYINNLLKDRDLSKKIYIYMSTKAGGDDFDPYENNYTFTNLNPTIIKGYVREITPETAFWKSYGLHQNGMKEILTEAKYRKYFELCNRIVIDSIDYQVFKSGTGNKNMIVERPFELIRVVVSRKG